MSLFGNTDEGAVFVGCAALFAIVAALIGFGIGLGILFS